MADKLWVLGVNPSLCLDCGKSGKTYDNICHTIGCNNNNGNQQFTFDGTNLKSVDGSKGLVWRGDSKWAQAHTDTDWWVKLEYDNTSKRFKIQGDNQCLDAYGSSNEGTDIEFESCNDSTHQKWIRRDVYQDCIARNINFLSVDCNRGYLDSCDRDWNYWEAKCDSAASNKSSEAFRKRKEFCNRNKENAFKDQCTSFCNVYGTDCDTRKRYDRCARFGISDADCTETNANNLKNKCVTYGFIDKDLEAALPNAPACTQASVTSFEKECGDYKIAVASCTADTLANAKTAKVIADEAEKTRLAAKELSDKTLETVKETGERNLQQFTETKNIVMDLVNIDLLPPDIVNKYFGGKENLKLVATGGGLLGIISSFSLIVLSALLGGGGGASKTSS